MSNQEVSPHIKFEGNGKVWIKKSIRPVKTYSANEYNRKPNASYNPSAARVAWRQERGPFKAAMAEEIKNQQAAATLLAMKRGTGGKRTLGKRKATKKTRKHHSRRRRVTRRR